MTSGNPTKATSQQPRIKFQYLDVKKSVPMKAKMTYSGRFVLLAERLQLFQTLL